MPRAPRDTIPIAGMYGGPPPAAPAGPRREWRAMTKAVGGVDTEHLAELRGRPGDRRWEPVCGGWASDGYRQVTRSSRRCVTCELIERGKR